MEPGTYRENVIINRENLVLIKEPGTAGEAMIMAHDQNIPAVTVTATGIRIVGFHISGAKNAQGIKILAGGCTVTNNMITGNGDGIYIENSSNNIISHNGISGNTGHGVMIYLSDNSSVTGNSISNNQGCGIYLLNVSNSIIEGNSMGAGGSDSIFLWTTNSTMIRGNTLNVGDNENGISLDKSYGNSVAGNVIDGGKIAVYLSGSYGNNITENTVNGGLCGILLDGAEMSWNNRISKNIIRNSQSAGITVYGSNNTITENTILSPFNGIWLGDEKIKGTWNNVVSGNTIKNSVMDSITVLDSDNVISRNTIEKSEGDGIEVSSSNNLISENTIIASELNGILVAGTGNTVTGNFISGSGNDGIWVIETAIITGNTITANGGRGIDLYSSNRSTVRDNIISRNRVGIYLEIYSNNNVVYNNILTANRIQAQNYGKGNIFNLPVPSGGNYWSDYKGSDKNGDGFGDTPYIFKGGRDNLPVTMQVRSIDPRGGSSNVPLNKTITITLNWNITPGPGYSSISVKTLKGTVKSITKRIDGKKLIISPAGSWDTGTIYIITVPSDALRNSIGAPLQTTFKSRFTTLQVPVNVSDIVAAAGTVKSYYDRYGRLPREVTVSSRNYTMAQFLYMITGATVNINRNILSPILPMDAGNPPWPAGVYRHGIVKRSSYVKTANSIMKFMKIRGRAPNYAITARGRIPFQKLVYIYSSILKYYGSEKRLPSSIHV
ncbi:NosD domain-containing protein [Methanothermobacter sp.]|uniref:NosD domain-containing protein n=1 Tax=Methanothermobacter sp. TaxID=1884223 RepID=UPI003C770542